MGIATYATLRSRVASWLNREDLVELIPDFIALAEADMNDKLRVQQMVTTKTATLTADRYPLPDDWLEAHTIKTVGLTRNRLLYASPDEIHQMRDENPSAPSPTHFSLWGGNIEVAPANGGATLEMSYFARIPSLTEDAPANWLLTRRPDAYLYGALMHAAPYLMEDERVQVWVTGYGNAISALNDADERARFSGAPLIRRFKSF
jgi:hypothetical protein